MPFIENIGMGDIKRGFHMLPGENAMLIQIVDSGFEFPTPKYTFKEVHQFEFMDLEENDKVAEDSLKCSKEQAIQLVELLRHAMDKSMNVIVHCHAGVSRSGAVCEVGVMMGFNDTEKFRIPNLLVKKLMMEELGINTYEQEPTIEEPKPIITNELELIKKDIEGEITDEPVLITEEIKPIVNNEPEDEVVDTLKK